MRNHPGQTDLDLSVTTGAGDAPWTGLVLFATDLFDPDSAASLASRWVRALDAVTSDPQLPVRDAPLMTPQERRTALGGVAVPVVWPTETVVEARRDDDTGARFGRGHRPRAHLDLPRTDGAGQCARTGA